MVPVTRWAPGAGPVPLPPRRPSTRRTLLAFGLPVVMVGAGLVGLLVLLTTLRSGDGPSGAVPRVVTPLTPTGPGTSGTPGGSGVTGGAAVTSPPPTTTSAVPQITATTTWQQADAVEELLDAAAKTPVTPTVTSLARCDATVDASTAVTTLGAAAANRLELLGRLRKVPVDKLPDGATLRAALEETWTQGAAADQHYLTWARGLVQDDSCNPYHPNKIGGDVDAGAARRAGTQFVEAWNTNVARPLHLGVRQVRDL